MISFETHPVSTGDVTHDVYLGPNRGPGVLLLHEVAGLTANTFELADGLSSAGFTVAVPHLFGRVRAEGGEALRTGAVGFLGRCIAREMSCLVANQPRRGTAWLAAAARFLADRSESPRGVGVIGMCATGSYALGAVFDANVGAVVASQAATPALRPGSWGIPGGLPAVRGSLKPVMTLRFQKDWRSGKRRVRRLQEAIGESGDVQRIGPDYDPDRPMCERAIEVTSGDLLHVIWADGSGHSVLNFDRVDLAVTKVIDFLDSSLKSPEQQDREV